MDFPGGLVIKNLPANAGDTGSIPGPGRSHMPVVPQAPSQCSRVCSAKGMQSQWESWAWKAENSPCSLQLENAQGQ